MTFLSHQLSFMSRYRSFFLWVLAYSSASMIRSACWRRCLDWPPPVMDQLCSGTCKSCSKNVATLRTTSSTIVSVWMSSRTGCGRYAMLFSDENPRVENSVGIHQRKRMKKTIRHAQLAGKVFAMYASREEREKKVKSECRMRWALSLMLSSTFKQRIREDYQPSYRQWRFRHRLRTLKIENDLLIAQYCRSSDVLLHQHSISPFLSRVERCADCC